jgi:endonuclease/exonuclease/phosphatase (EEP) superfamily protein YafD
MRPATRAVALLGGLSLALSLLPTGTEPRAEARPRHEVTSQIRLVTYNARHDVRPARTVKEVRALARVSDIMTLQEMSSGKKRAGIKRGLVSCKGCRWGAYMPRAAVPGGTPILFRKRQYRLERTGTRRVSEPTRVGGSGAGPATVRAKYINFVRLTERRTGRTVWVLNNHTVASVQGDRGRPNRRHSARLRLYRKHMAGLTALVTKFRRKGGMVFATGDFNVNHRTDRRAKARMFPFATMRSVGMRASYVPLGQPKRGTHVLDHGRRDRLIDYVHHLPRVRLWPREQRILRGYASDHRPLLVRYQIASRRRR